MSRPRSRCGSCADLGSVEDKLDDQSRKRKRSGDDEDGSQDSDSSSTDSEDEDDAGELATEILDSEIAATLNAIRSKDPRVYDSKTTFYKSLEEENGPEKSKAKKEKPMFLRDYQREKLLNGKGLEDAEEEEERRLPLTYNEEQEALKKKVVGEMHAAVGANTGDDSDDGGDSSEDDFLKTKPRAETQKAIKPTVPNVEEADKDREIFLSNFMAARAWVPTSKSRFQPLESDDDDEDRRAEEYEQAYNFRFEDPSKANETITSHARDIAAKHSVRREETNPRKKRRDLERERKEAKTQELVQDRARLRKLKVEEAEEKLKKIKRAAGLRARDLETADWSRFLDDVWDDDRWEEEMQKHFGEAYYAANDIESEEEKLTNQLNGAKHKLKKPKWEDDIDIKDLVPNFEDEGKAEFSLSEDEFPQGDGDALMTNGASEHKKTSKDHKKERQENKSQSRKERRIIEQLVDDQLKVDTALLGEPSKKGGFRYRDTSPTSFGLSAREILLAPDSHLNEFAGLKKLAAFRDPERKRKDQRHLGKRARLRKWRMDTFGDEEGIDGKKLVHAAEEKEDDAGESTNIQTTGTRKKKRRRKSKTAGPGAMAAE